MNQRWWEYAFAHSAEVPKLLVSLERETHQKILQPRMLCGPLQGRFLSLISKLLRPDKIIEVGTFTGYATLCLAEGLTQKGEIYTIDCNEELVFIQQKYFQKSPQANQIKPLLGSALNVLPLLEGPFDLVYLDADKINYDQYFEMVLPKMRKGGLIISDNVLWDGKVIGKVNAKDEVTKTLQAYNHKLKNDARVHSVMLPFRDGITLSWVN